MKSVLKYKDHTATQLALEPRFIRWVKNPNAHQDAFWQQYIQRCPHQKAVVAKARLIAANMKIDIAAVTPVQSERMWKKISRSVQKPLYNFWRTAAAACLLAVVGYFTYKALQPGNPKAKAALHIKEIHPAINQATLALADGTIVSLDSMQKSIVAADGHIQITNTQSHRTNYNTGKATAPNTLSTPRAGQYQLALPDGSKAWLNAASSITFPAIFAGTERVVSATGEVYFEVTKDANKPFIVKLNNAEVKVLGTHFNIKNYNDGSTGSITLLQGKVSVENQTGTATLMPGQQAMLGKENIAVINNVNTDEVMGWKNGQFVLENMDLAAFMKELERWYDVDVEYTGKIPALRLGFNMSRKVSLTTLIAALNEYGIKCKIQGKKIIIK